MIVLTSRRPPSHLTKTGDTFPVSRQKLKTEDAQGMWGRPALKQRDVFMKSRAGINGRLWQRGDPSHRRSPALPFPQRTKSPCSSASCSTGGPTRSLPQETTSSPMASSCRWRVSLLRTEVWIPVFPRQCVPIKVAQCQRS